MSDRLHVTFVCTGNICRSPIAEKVFAHQIAERGLADLVRVSSAGTRGWHVGEGADERARAVLRAHGYPDAHRGAEVDDDHLDADVVVAMAGGHVQLLAHAGVGSDRLRLMRSFDPDPAVHTLDVEDPYYGGPADFAETLAVVESAMPGLHDLVAAQLAERGLVDR